jgi:hypothetical protein
MPTKVELTATACKVRDRLRYATARRFWLDFPL